MFSKISFSMWFKGIALYHLFKFCIIDFDEFITEIILSLPFIFTKFLKKSVQLIILNLFFIFSGNFSINSLIKSNFSIFFIGNSK